MIRYKDIEKERDLLAILLNSKRANKQEVLQRLDVVTFTTTPTRKLFFLIKDYHHRYFSPINVQIALERVDELDTDIKIKNKIRRLIKKLKEHKVSIKMLDYLIEELLVYEHSRNIQTTLITAKDIFKQTGDPYAVKDFLQDSIHQQRSREQHDIEILDLRGDFKRRFKYIKKARENPEIVKGIESGIDPRFDDELSGYSPGGLYIFVANTSGGKSICMQDQAVFMAVELDKKVAFITNEMTAEETAFRMDARISQIRYSKFKKPKNMRNIDLEKWKCSMEDLLKNGIKIIGMHEHCSIQAIDSELSKINYLPNIVFIDYIQNMEPSSYNSRELSFSNDAQPQAIVVREAKHLALKRKVPIISAGQLKPEAEEKERISISDIAISKQALSYNADGLFAILQSERMKRMNPPRARIQFVKVRSGKTREFIEVLPNFGLIRLNDPKKKRKKKKRKSA